jgi:uncharacterized membrane protein YqhA
MEPNKARSRTPLVERLLEQARYVMIVPTVLLVFATLAVFVYSVVYSVDAARKVFHHPYPISHNVGLIIVEIDLVLVGATLLVTAAGLYELFVARPGAGQHPAFLPRWLVMRDLNDLKARIVSMLVLVAAVSFVEAVVDLQEGVGVLYLGAAVALVIGALTLFSRFGSGMRQPEQGPTWPEPSAPERPPGQVRGIVGTDAADGPERARPSR